MESLIGDMALSWALFLPIGITVSFANWISNNRVFNVKDYGAVGDDTADDTTTIRAALTAANTAGGGVVYVPRSTYKVTGTLTNLF